MIYKSNLSGSTRCNISIWLKEQQCLSTLFGSLVLAKKFSLFDHSCVLYVWFKKLKAASLYSSFYMWDLFQWCTWSTNYCFDKASSFFFFQFSCWFEKTIIFQIITWHQAKREKTSHVTFLHRYENTWLFCFASFF